MRIVMIATGSRGDVEPYIALGVGLRAAGYEVRVLTHEDLAPLASARGLDAWPIQGRVQDIAQSTDMSRLLEQGNFLRVLAQMARDAREGATRAGPRRDGGLSRCGRGAGRPRGDLVRLRPGRKVRSGACPSVLYPLHADLRLPELCAAPQPPRRDRGDQPAELPHGAADDLAGLPAGGQAQPRARARPSPAPFWGPFGSERMRRAPVLYGYSPAVIPPPPDWEGRAIVTGYWMAAPDDAWEPPSDLARFLEGGDPPVYIGFGSMSSRHPEQTAELVLGALARTGRRGIVLSGWGGIGHQRGISLGVCADRAPPLAGCSRAWPPWCTMAAQARPPRACGPASPR